MNLAKEYAQRHAERFKDELVEWLRIPSVSTDPAFQGDVQRAAEWLADNMRRIGLQNVAVMPTGGHPAVYGDWLNAGPGAPTILIYGHYDVQPAVMADGWSHAPFEPYTVGERLFARGATDDKGQTMIQLKAAESMLASGECPVNLKYIIEGEEEIGSPHLAAFMQDHKDLLKADICVISDTAIAAEDQPTLCYALRGLTTFELHVQGPKTDVHSGGYGGIIHNPAQAVAEIVAALHTPDGRVAVPGFYDEVRELSAEERRELAKGEFPEESWRSIMGDLPEWGEAGYNKVERTGARPTLEINGIYGGYAGAGFKTVLPARAGAKISCRLVPDQDPNVIFERVRDYIMQIAPKTVKVWVDRYDQGNPAITPIDHPAVQAAVRAYAANWEKPVIYTRGGGSVPIVTDVQDILGLPVVLLGFALPDCAAHGPDESFHLGMYRKGVDTVITYMHEVAKAR